MSIFIFLKIFFHIIPEDFFYVNRQKLPFHHNLKSSPVKFFCCVSALLRYLLYSLRGGPLSTKNDIQFKILESALNNTDWFLFYLFAF